MKTEYRNSNPIIVNDDKTGVEEREYQDNIEEILLTENEMELLTQAIKEKKKVFAKKEHRAHILSGFSASARKTFQFITCICIFSMCSLMVVFVLGAPKCILNMFAAYNMLAISLNSAACVYYNSKSSEQEKAESEKDAINKEISFLEEELKRQNEKEEELKSNKTQNIDPTNEIVSLKEQNEYRQGLLKKRMALIESYYENKESQPSFENNLLLNENITEEEQEIKEVLLRLVAKKIEKK